jgi:hypothetical protein
METGIMFDVMEFVVKDGIRSINKEVVRMMKTAIENGEFVPPIGFYKELRVNGIYMHPQFGGIKNE